MAFEGIYAAPMRPAWLVDDDAVDDDDTSTPDFPAWKMTKTKTNRKTAKTENT